MTSRAAALPPHMAPRFLSRAEAAAYLGVSGTVFDSEVRTGLWPAPLRRGARESRLTWDRLLIDAWADRHSGLAPATLAPTLAAPGTSQAPDQEAIALERSGHASTPKLRRQGRRQEAA